MTTILSGKYCKGSQSCILGLSQGDREGPGSQSCFTNPARSRAAWEYLGAVRLQVVQQRTSRRVRCVEHPREKEKLREMCFSGLEKSKQEGEANSSLLAVYLQGAVGMTEEEIKNERTRGSSHELQQKHQWVDLRKTSFMTHCPEKLENHHP